MRLCAVKTRIVKIGDNLVDVIVKSLKAQNLHLEDYDVLALTSKIVSCAKGQLVKLNDVKPSERALKLANEYLRNLLCARQKESMAAWKRPY
jgi:F420-0:gamma-glutamyl ligase